MLQSSVWEKTSKIDRTKLLDGKYFDISSIEDIYVKFQNNSLQNVVGNYKITELSRRLSKSYKFLHKKIFAKQSIYLKDLVEILYEVKGWSKVDMIKFLEHSKCLFGSGQGKPNLVKLPLSYNPKLEKAFAYLQPYNDGMRMLVHENLALIRKTFGANIRKEDSSNILASKVLCAFIKKFVVYKKNYKINFDIVKSIDVNHVDLLRGLLIPFVVTDGSYFLHKGKHHYIEFFGDPTNKSMHDIFVYSVFNVLNKYPTSYMVLNKEGNLIKTRFLLDNNSYNKIVKEVRSFKTSPANGQSILQYLKETQPSIDYLNKCNEETQKWVLRVWFSTEGCISVNRSRFNQYIRPSLSLACAHPALVDQLQRLASKFGIDMSVQKDSRRWHGVGGLFTRNYKSVENFYKIGGFLPKVYMAGNSAYYRGIEKQKLLCTVLKVCKEKQERFKTMPIKAIHKELRLVANRFTFN